MLEEAGTLITFELWCTRSRNILGFFESEAAALAAVREALRVHGADYAETLALVREDSHGRSVGIAQGGELAERALAAA